MSKNHYAWTDWPQTKTLVKAFAGEKLRFVGGCVRDSLLGKEVKDVDAATPLAPDAVEALLAKAGIRSIPTGKDHGTITAVIDGKSFEITTLRKDVATDGRHATVEYTEDWKADASRRDFTMNAMYLSPEGELFDYFGGEGDARAGQVHFIGDAAQRISEDYLRILRFFRFHAWYGKGDPEAQGLKACAVAANHIATLSGERIQQEMVKLLSAEIVSPTLKTMQETGVLAQLLGRNLQKLDAIERLEHMERTPKAHVRLALLLLAIPQPEDALAYIVEKWKLPNATIKRLRQLLMEHLRADMPMAEQKRILRRLSAEVFSEAVLVSAASIPFDPTPLLQLAESWQIPVFPVTGDDLIARGVKPGKDMGALLSQLEEQWENSDYSLSCEQLLKPVA